MFNYGTNLDVRQTTNLAIGQENDFEENILDFLRFVRIRPLDL
jgi:hypothetical protein